MIPLFLACADPSTPEPPPPPASSTPAPGVDADADGYPEEVDCDDTRINVNPGRQELCNGLDDDCDGVVDGPDALEAVDGFTDGDGDGFGGLTRRGCYGEPGFVVSGGDCLDTDVFVRPGARERCDGGDDDCDPATPDVCFECVWLSDGDVGVRYALDGALLDVRAGCSFVGIHPDGQLYSDAGHLLEIRDPVTCARVGVLQPQEALAPYLGDTGTSTIFDPQSAIVAVAWGPEGDPFVLYGASAFQVESWGIARFEADGSYAGVVHAADGPPASDLAVGPDGWLYVLVDSEILRLPAIGDDTLPEVMAVVTRPTSIEVRPGLFYVHEDGSDSVVRFDAVSRAALGVFVADAGEQPRDLAFLPDGTLLSADYGSASQLVRAFDGVSGAPLDTWAAGRPEQPVARLSLGPCP